jgi:biotin carboxyl carrier protein
MEKNFKINVNKSFNYDLKKSDLEQLNLLKLSKNKLHLINKNKPYIVEIVKENFSSKKYVLKINANTYTVEISNQLDILINEMGFSSNNNKTINNIKAPMPGIILNVLVKNNQKVQKGDNLLILEAMKMENTISAPRNGTVKFVHVKKGNTVEKGKLLFEII